jgi:transcriptional regulator with XRE-family HTH domain
MGYAEKLQKLCAMRGLDQSELAARVGISKSSMSRIVSGAQEPKIQLARSLAKELGVTLDYLVDESMEATTSSQLIAVTEDELLVLKIVRRLGPNVAMDRLLAVGPPPEARARPEAAEPRADAAPSQA